MISILTYKIYKILNNLGIQDQYVGQRHMLNSKLANNDIHLYCATSPISIPQQSVSQILPLESPASSPAQSSLGVWLNVTSLHSASSPGYDKFG